MVFPFDPKRRGSSFTTEEAMNTIALSNQQAEMLGIIVSCLTKHDPKLRPRIAIITEKTINCHFHFVSQRSSSWIGLEKTNESSVLQISPDFTDILCFPFKLAEVGISMTTFLLSKRCNLHHPFCIALFSSNNIHISHDGFKPAQLAE